MKMANDILDFEENREYVVEFLVTSVDVFEGEFDDGTCEMCLTSYDHQYVDLTICPVIDGVEMHEISFSIETADNDYGHWEFFDLGNLMTVGDRFREHSRVVTFESSRRRDVMRALEREALHVMRDVSYRC